MQSVKEVVPTDNSETSWRPFRQTHLVCHELDGEGLLYDPQRGITHRLNGSALFIWQSCDGQKTTDSIAGELMRTFDVDADTAEGDVRKALEQMRVNQLIE